MNFNTAINLARLANSDPDEVGINAAKFFNDAFFESNTSSNCDKMSKKDKELEIKYNELKYQINKPKKPKRKMPELPEEIRCEAECVSGNRCSKKKIENQPYCMIHCKKHRLLVPVINKPEPIIKSATKTKKESPDICCVIM